ncbi:MAG: TVP38/TMEM64 family protein [Brevinema sp.]
MKKYNILFMLLFFVVGIILINHFDIASQLKLENIPKLKEWFTSLGWISFFIYLLLYICGCLFFLPGLPITLLGGILFGPIFGTLYTIISASIGLALAFLCSRYFFRDIMQKKLGSSEIFTKIDNGVKTQGWRILMITRLVPLFPFNIQNYLYGLTDIKFFTYWILSTIFIIPGTATYTLSVGSILSGNFSTQTLIYLGIAAVCFVFVSFIPKLLLKEKKYNDRG